MDIVRVENLRKAFGNFVAVNDISFSIAEGEIFGFLGPNGAGKTSTINMLIGLSMPTSGSIFIDNIDCTKKIKKAQAIMGIVPDESNLYDEMNGFDNLCFCGSLYGMKKQHREQRAMELLELFNLSDALNKSYKTYSKGMRRKLCIAAGFMHSPRILFLDEPTTGIDVESARFIRNIILDLKKQGTTVFITTHYLEDAQRICDRIAFIVGGKIVKTGTLAQLMANANNEYIIQIKHSGSPANLTQEFNSTFKECKLKIKNEQEFLLHFTQQVSLTNPLQFFDKKGITIYEAKEIQPTLEDIFIKVTGEAKK